MAQTYGIVNMISSLGFTVRWRRQCVQAITIPEDASCLDLMAGMGETCHNLARVLGPTGRITALDISRVMCKHIAEKTKYIGLPDGINAIHADVLACPLSDDSFDVVVSTFGLKTFNEEQTKILASEVYRILKPGGRFSFLEISIPPLAVLRLPYIFYLKYMIPFIGRIFMGNPDNYRLLYVYTAAFKNGRSALDAFAKAGLQAEYQSRFFGCASLVCGSKPKSI